MPWRVPISIGCRMAAPATPGRSHSRFAASKVRTTSPEETTKPEEKRSNQSVERAMVGAFLFRLSGLFTLWLERFSSGLVVSSGDETLQPERGESHGFIEDGAVLAPRRACGQDAEEFTGQTVLRQTAGDRKSVV